MISVQDLARFFQLSREQEKQFDEYLIILKEWNRHINLTAIKDDSSIVSNHFADSLYVTKFLDFTSLSSLADVGAGAGFPALPIKIKYPHLFIVLIEVNGKKIQFLEALIEKLALQNIEIYSFDWRTFLRRTNYDLDLFVARASLQVSELLRIFSPASSYNNSQLLYWASQHWQPNEKEKPFIDRQEWYEIQNKKRKIVFFGKKTEDKGFSSVQD